jgi:hypothetical protein
MPTSVKPWYPRNKQNYEAVERITVQWKYAEVNKLFCYSVRNVEYFVVYKKCWVNSYLRLEL